MGEHDRHRERTKQKYVDGRLKDPSDSQLLEILLFYLIRRKDVRPMAESLISRSGSILRLLTMPRDELMAMNGVGKKTAEMLALVGEVMNRSEVQRARVCALTDPSEVCGYIRARLKYLKDESIFIICVDEKLHPIDCGIFDDGQPLINEIICRASMFGVKSVILAGNCLTEFPALSVINLDSISSLNRKLSGVGIVLLDYIRISDEMFSSAAELGALADGAPIRINYRHTITAPLRRTKYKVEDLI